MPVIPAWGGEDRMVRNSRSFSVNLWFRDSLGYSISNKQANKYTVGFLL